ncbi:MAG TPA: hypothetical protein VN554_02325 [Verrucomicrobiae bacterium]|nr:hypothetical protein [Verrucomicrobiae bacterium]
MSHKKLNQKGFAALEAVLVIVILAIVGGTAYYVYHANNKSTDTQNAAHTSVESAQATTTTKSASAAGVQAKKIYGNLLNAYKKNGTAKTDWDVTYVDSPAAKDQFTADFKKTVDAGTAWSSPGPFCTSTYTFEGFTVDKSTLSGDTANVSLALTVKGKKSADYPTPVNLTLQYASGKWAIAQQECGAATTTTD